MTYGRPSIGNMSSRVTLQRKTETQNDSGGQAVVWSDVTDIWAKIEAEKMDKYLIAQGLTQVLTHKISIRYRSDITTHDRLVWGSRTFQIHGIVIVEERDRFMVLSCQEGVGS